MAMTKAEVALLAASALSNGRVAQIAADYETWIAAQDTEATAILALLAVHRRSKSPATVKALAAKRYAEIEADPAVVTAALSPATGSTSGGTAVTVTGHDFTGATAVTLGGNACTSLVVVNDTTITCVTPAHAAGAVGVTVTTPVGTSAARANSFTYA